MSSLITNSLRPFTQFFATTPYKEDYQLHIHGNVQAQDPRFKEIRTEDATSYIKLNDITEINIYLHPPNEFLESKITKYSINMNQSVDNSLILKGDCKIIKTLENYSNILWIEGTKTKLVIRMASDHQKQEKTMQWIRIACCISFLAVEFIQNVALRWTLKIALGLFSPTSFVFTYIGGCIFSQCKTIQALMVKKCYDEAMKKLVTCFVFYYPSLIFDRTFQRLEESLYGSNESLLSSTEISISDFKGEKMIYLPEV